MIDYAYRLWLNLYHAAQQAGYDDETAAEIAFAIAHGQRK
jgi:hypothetical protein